MYSMRSRRGSAHCLEGLLEGQDQRTWTGQYLEEAADRREQLVGAAGLLRRPDRDRDLTGDPFAVVLPDQQLGEATQTPGAGCLE